MVSVTVSKVWVILWLISSRLSSFYIMWCGFGRYKEVLKYMRMWSSPADTGDRGSLAVVLKVFKGLQVRYGGILIPRNLTELLDSMMVPVLSI